MKGIVLAGGHGSRLAPLTNATNKMLLPVGREPMMYHAIRQLRSAEITDILIITSTGHMGDIGRCLGSGERFGCSISYRIQETAGGIAHALKLARSFGAQEKTVVMLGDNIFEYSIRPYVQAFRAQERGARVLLKEVTDPERFGVATLEGARITEIEEKPAAPKSRHAVVGLYMFDDQVWDILDQVQPSARGELEVTSVTNAYIDRRQLHFDHCVGRWTDAGTFPSLQEANLILSANHNKVLEHP